MKFKHLKISLTFIQISLLFSTSSSTPSYDYSTICNTTPYPTFCNSLLSTYRNTMTIQDSTRFCIDESLLKTNNIQSLINTYLQSSHSNSYPLQDCHYLANLNIEFLSTTYNTINSSNTLDKDVTNQVQTTLSAILTNLNTCSEGLQLFEPSSSLLHQDLSPHFTDNLKLNSVSLALFTHGWGKNNGKSFNLPFKGILNLNGLPLNLGQMLKLASYGKKWDNVFYEMSVCGVKVNQMVIVNKDGSGDFTTITEAVNIAPSNSNANSGYFGIYVVGGVYEEYVNIGSNKKYLLMVGDGINQTIITGSRSVGAGWTTFNSGSFAVSATGFIAVDMTFRNAAGAIMQQAVALRNGADLSAFYRCSFEGYQDTLLTHSFRQFYKNCDIYGTVDFLFGNAAVVFQDCNIYVRQPLKGQFNAITAQGREDPNQNTGISIHHCNIRPTRELKLSNYTVQTYLGRPWKTYSRTVYMQSYMHTFINSQGWHEWNGSFALDTLYYAEFDNFGSGSDARKRVTWPGYHVINAYEASDFTVSNFIMGDYWLPSTGVPYNGGFYYR